MMVVASSAEDSAASFDIGHVTRAPCGHHQCVWISCICTLLYMQVICETLTHQFQAGMLVPPLMALHHAPVSAVMLLQALQRTAAAAVTLFLPFNGLQKSFAALAPQARQPTVKVQSIDVDEASSSAPPATFLHESDHYPTN